MAIDPVGLAARTQMFSEFSVGRMNLLLPNQAELEAALNGLVKSGVHPKLIGTTVGAFGGAMLGLTCSALIGSEESPTDVAIAGAIVGGGLGLLLF